MKQEHKLLKELFVILIIAEKLRSKLFQMSMCPPEKSCVKKKSFADQTEIKNLCQSESGYSERKTENRKTLQPFCLNKK